MLLQVLQRIREQLARFFKGLRICFRRLRGRKLNYGLDCDLPIDVLELIFEACSELRTDPESWGLVQPTLAAASRVNSVWHDLATKHLYRDVYLSSINALRQFRTTLEEHADLRPLVRRFCFTYPAFVTGDIELPRPDDCFTYESKICDLCPNLEFQRRRLLHDKVLGLLKHGDSGIQNVTHLVLHGMGCLPVAHWVVSPSFIELPRLQSFEVSVTFAADKKLVWFRMPQLRRLALVNLVIPDNRKFTLPEHSPLIDTIEVLSCYDVIRDFFVPESSPLVPFRTTLARLTITSKADWCLPTPEWSLGFLTGLKQLCLPFSYLVNASIVDFPPNLAELAFIGDSLGEEELHRILGICALRLTLAHRHKIGLAGLKRAIVRVRDAGTWMSESEVKGVRLDLGVGNTTGHGLVSFRQERWLRDSYLQQCE